MKIKNVIHYGKCFGMKMFSVRALRKLTGDNTSPLGYRYAPKYDKIIIDYLMEHVVVNMDVQKILSGADIKSTKVPKIIWMMWWQGIEQAPDIVKMCVSQIYKQNTSCKIYLIDKNNYSDFVDISEEIMEKMRTGKIILAHFSDMIRFQLLARFGGVWVDATLFTTAPMDTAVFNAHFYSVHSEVLTGEPSYAKWTNFFMTTPPNSPLFLFVEEFLKTYFRTFDHAIDYYVTFYAMVIAGKLIPEVQKWMNSVPINNELCFHLYPTLNKDSSRGIAYLNGNTTIFKLSHHKNKSLCQKRFGKETTYGYLIRNFEIGPLG